jgi:hypothetical protein
MLALFLAGSLAVDPPPAEGPVLAPEDETTPPPTPSPIATPIPTFSDTAVIGSSGVHSDSTFFVVIETQAQKRSDLRISDLDKPTAEEQIGNSDKADHEQSKTIFETANEQIRNNERADQGHQEESGSGVTVIAVCAVLGGIVCVAVIAVVCYLGRKGSRTMSDDQTLPYHAALTEHQDP